MLFDGFAVVTFDGFVASMASSLSSCFLSRGAANFEEAAGHVAQMLVA
jgi:hypothetical protein